MLLVLRVQTHPRLFEGKGSTGKLSGSLNATVAHLRVSPANCTVVPQSPLKGVGRFVREEPLGEDDRFVLRVDSDEQHEVHTIPERFNARARMVSLEAALLCVKI